MEYLHSIICTLMTASYLACGSLFLLALAHFGNASGANRMANIWLGVFFCCTGGALLEFIAWQTSLGAHYPWLIPLTESVRFALAPSLYLSILYFTQLQRSFSLADGLHFIPLLLFLPLLYPGDFHLPKSLGIIIGISIKVQLPVYWILSCRLLWQHQQVTREMTAHPPPVNLNWVKYLLLGIVVMMLLWYNQVFRINSFVARLSGIGYLGAVYLIGFFSLRQREVFPYQAADKLALQPVVDKKTAAPRLSDDSITQLKMQLDQLMEQEQVFTDGDLDLPQLARAMNIPVHELSCLLNKGYGQNFYQYINHHRVNRAKVLLHSEKHAHLSILGIAFDAGFNSKTTFNTAFKKATGMSPGVFRNLPVRMDTTEH